MKKLLSTSIVALLTINANAANMPRAYVSAHFGYDATHVTITNEEGHNVYTVIDAKHAYNVSGSFGIKYDLNSSLALRGEIEHNFIESHFKNLEVNLKTNIILANVFVDFKTSLNLNPYFTFGAGYQWNHLVNRHTSKDIAAQVGGGLMYKINDNLAFDLGYRQLSSLKVRNGGDSKYFVGHHQFRLGSSYTF